MSNLTVSLASVDESTALNLQNAIVLKQLVYAWVVLGTLR